MALVRVYCGLASTDLSRDRNAKQKSAGAWLTVAVVDDAGRLLDICDISDDAAGYAQLGALLAERSSGPASVAVAADTDDHLVTRLLTAAGRYLAYTDEDSADDYADRFGDDDSIEELESNPAERRAIGLARALQAGVLSAVPQATPRDLLPLKPVLAAHAAVNTGRQGAACTLREVLRELYPAALRAYPDPAEPLPLAILDALPEPGLLGANGAGRGREAQVVAELAATGVGESTQIADAIMALQVAIAETPRRTGMNRSVTTAVAEAIRQSVAAVRACDAAAVALVGVMDERMGRGSVRSVPQWQQQPATSPVPAAPMPAAPAPMPAAPVPMPAAPAPAPMPAAPAPMPAVPAAVAPPPAFPEPAAFPAPTAFPGYAPPAPYAAPAPPPPGITPILPRRDMPNRERTSPAAGPRPPIVAQPMPAAQRSSPPAPASVSPAPPSPAFTSPTPMPSAPMSGAPMSGAPMSPAAPYSPAAPLSPAAPAAGYSPAPPPVGPPTLDPPTFPGFERTGDLPVYRPSHLTNEPPAPRLSPDTTPPGSRAGWPLVGDPLGEPARPFEPEPLDVTITSYPRFDFSEPIERVRPAERAAEAPRHHEGRVKPPWQADDLPAEPPEPPVLRLVEPTPPPELAFDPLSLDLPYPDRFDDEPNGDSFFAPPPPDLRLVEVDDGDRAWRDTAGWSTLEDVNTPISLVPISLAPAEGEESDGDLLIFAATRSAWFTDHIEPDADEVDWTTPADLGWRAAEHASRPVVGDETMSGLPKRIPQQNLVPGSPINTPDRQLRIVRNAESIAANTNGYFQGWRRGQQVGGYAVGGRPGRDSASGWDFNRDNTGGFNRDSAREYAERDRDYEYRAARR